LINAIKEDPADVHGRQRPRGPSWRPHGGGHTYGTAIVGVAVRRRPRNRPCYGSTIPRPGQAAHQGTAAHPTRRPAPKQWRRQDGSRRLRLPHGPPRPAHAHHHPPSRGWTSRPWIWPGLPLRYAPHGGSIPRSGAHLAGHNP